MVGNDKEIYIMTLSLGNFTTVSVVWYRSYSEGGDATLASSTFNVWKKKKKEISVTLNEHATYVLQLTC